MVPECLESLLFFAGLESIWAGSGLGGFASSRVGEPVHPTDYTSKKATGGLPDHHGWRLMHISCAMNLEKQAADIRNALRLVRKNYVAFFVIMPKYALCSSNSDVRTSQNQWLSPFLLLVVADG